MLNLSAATELVPEFLPALLHQQLNDADYFERDGPNVAIAVYFLERPQLTAPTCQRVAQMPAEKLGSLTNCSGFHFKFGSLTS